MARALYPRGSGRGKRKPRFLGSYWRGSSQLDGQPIVVVFTFRSGNRKTGKMVQTWILKEDVSPQLAVKLGLDFTICGDCKQRPSLGGKCYVTVARAPLAVWKAWKAGRYEPLDLVAIERGTCRRFEGRILRIGSYGDPVAVDPDVWDIILGWGGLKGHTGYTHQWRHPAAVTFADFVMASVDSPEEFKEASSQGWRCFRTIKPDDPLMPREGRCPASAEMGHRIQCVDCRVPCNGALGVTRNGRLKDQMIRGHRAIVEHGFRIKKGGYNGAQV